MPLITAAVRGDLRAAMEAEVRDAAGAMRRGVERAGARASAELGSPREPLRLDAREIEDDAIEHRMGCLAEHFGCRGKRGGPGTGRRGPALVTS